MRLGRLAAIFLILFVPLQAATGATLKQIKARGSIRIAVKFDYKPWGFTDKAGNLQGMEPELARDIAKRLKVKLVLVPATSSNRIQLLNEGKADIVLATFSVTEERKKEVAFIEPSYYAAMTAVLTRAKSDTAKSSSLKGRKLCAVAGNYANQAVTAIIGTDLIELKTLPEAEDRLIAGGCDGVTFDDVVLLYQLQSEPDKWQDYDISPLLGVKPAPWGIAVPLAEKDGALAAFLSKTVTDWHRKGTLLRLEKKWVGANSMAMQWLTSKVNAKASPSKTPSKSPGR